MVVSPHRRFKFCLSCSGESGYGSIRALPAAAGAGAAAELPQGSAADAVGAAAAAWLLLLPLLLLLVMLLRLPPLGHCTTDCHPRRPFEPLPCTWDSCCCVFPILSMPLLPQLLLPVGTPLFFRLLGIHRMADYWYRRFS